MEFVGFDEVSLADILKEFSTNDKSEAMFATVSSNHMDDLRFSDNYVIKRIGEQEFAFFSTICFGRQT